MRCERGKDDPATPALIDCRGGDPVVRGGSGSGGAGVVGRLEAIDGHVAGVTMRLPTAAAIRSRARDGCDGGREDGGSEGESGDDLFVVLGDCEGLESRNEVTSPKSWPK